MTPVNQMTNHPARRPVTRSAGRLVHTAAWTTLLLLGVAGCGSDAQAEAPGSSVTQSTGGSGAPDTAGEAASADSTDTGAEEPSEVDGTSPGLDGDYAFGLEREQMLEVVEKTYASRNASATWDGDRLVVTMDGDAEGPLGASSDCRVLTEIVTEDDLVGIEFPNGSFLCEDVLAQ